MRRLGPTAIRTHCGLPVGAAMLNLRLLGARAARICVRLSQIYAWAAERGDGRCSTLSRYLRPRARFSIHIHRMGAACAFRQRRQYRAFREFPWSPLRSQAACGRWRASALLVLHGAAIWHPHTASSYNICSIQKVGPVRCDKYHTVSQPRRGMVPTGAAWAHLSWIQHGVPSGWRSVLNQ